jgi:hypothetical protein
MPSALLLGGAQSVWTDAAAAMQLSAFDAIATVNDAGVHWPDTLDFWVSFHTEPNRFPKWIAERAARGHPPARVIAATSPEPYVTFPAEKYEGLPNTGTSALLAVKVLRDHGFDRIVLAGVPMSRAGGHFVRREPWADADKYREAWAVVAPRIAPYVRSMSGWTRETFGAPDAAFLTE